VKYLLDTHVIIWWLDDPDRLSKKARDVLVDARNVIFISAASIWEIGLKVRRGKLTVPDNYVDYLREDGFAFLDITMEHSLSAPQLPLHHEDPFDRLLVAQAHLEDSVFISRNEQIAKYDVVSLEA
jgi:PIN domain nuclease of toxin-antitoxin system